VVFSCVAAGWGWPGLVAFLHCCLDIKGILLGRYHYCLYYLVPALQVSHAPVHPWDTPCLLQVL